MKFIILAVIVVVVIGLFLIKQSNPNNTDSGETARISMQTVKDDTATGAVLLDVRTPEEFHAGHIDGSANFPLQSIQAGSLPTVAKDKTVYVYCQSGNRSKQATSLLKAAGYSNVVDLGGITDVKSIGGEIKT